jgi:hypothetical protein
MKIRKTANCLDNEVYYTTTHDFGHALCSPFFTACVRVTLGAIQDVLDGQLSKTCKRLQFHSRRMRLKLRLHRLLGLGS